MIKNIIISNSKELEKTKKQILEAGKQKLHILADFDRTLTKAFVNNEKIPSIISVLRDGNYLTKDYAKKAHELFNTYHPIEINPNISKLEKTKKMKKWWTIHFDLLIKSGLNKKDIKKVVESGKIQLRQGTSELLDFLNKNNIPLIIMSSVGLGGDSISMFLEKQGKLYNNIHIISNSFKWDKDGNAIGVKKPIIHNMNKDETSVKGLPIYNKLKKRKNVILLGDSLSDTDMIKGFDYINLISIGFLNYDVKASLEHFKQAYDIVILNDDSMNYVNELLKEVVK